MYGLGNKVESWAMELTTPEEFEGVLACLNGVLTRENAISVNYEQIDAKSWK